MIKNTNITIEQYYNKLINDNNLSDIIISKDNIKCFDVKDIFINIKKYQNEKTSLYNDYSINWNSKATEEIRFLMRNDFMNYIKSENFINNLIEELRNR